MGSIGSKRYWGTDRVARACQVSPATVAHWIDQGHLQGHKTPTGRRRVSVGTLAAFLRQHGMALPPELAGVTSRDIVVMVEDDPDFRLLVSRAVKQAQLDIELVQAATGVDGLLEIGRVQPSLIVLDYKLPDLNAGQVIERLLEPRRQLDAEVIVVTGGLTRDDEEGLRRVGVKTIVNKADGLQAVVDAIRQGLERREAA